MAQSGAYATRQEVEVLETEIKRLSVQQTVLADGLRDLTVTVARLAEEMNARFDAVDVRFERLTKEIADGHATLLSAILKLGPR